MSDDAPAVDDQKKKRGRPSTKTGEKNAVKETKKRGRTAAEKTNSIRAGKSDTEEDGPPGPVKRGRGRPKGSHKKKSPAKSSNASSGRGRGRPKKVEEKPESTGEDEDEQEEEEEEEEN